MPELRKRQPRPLEVAVAAAIAMATLGSSAAFAQANRELEEIVVTSERRVATEATTAISMEVLTDEFIAENQIKDIIDLQNAVPALQFFQNGSYVQANIRGVGNPSTGGPSEQVGVPVFFDGGTQGEEMSLASGFFDVGDVQVLRGPQATFVGQSAVGGAILINSARPNFDGVNGYIEGTVGTYGQRKVMGGINLPITDNLAGRISYMSENRDSFYTNVSGNASTGGEQYVPGDQEDDNYRFGLLWEPNEQLSLYAKLERTELHTYGVPDQPNPYPYTGFRDDDCDPDTPSVPVFTYDQNAQGPAPGTGILADHDCDAATPDVYVGGTPGPGGAIYDPLDPFTIDNRIPESRIQTNDRITLEVNYVFESGITFRSLSNSIKMDRLQVEGGNSAVFQSPTGFQLGPGMHTWSQEFNLISPEGQRVEWLLGAYKNDRHTELHLNIPLGNPDCGWEYDGSWSPCPTLGERGGSFFWTSDDDVVHQALYGQVNFQLNDTLELTVEARFNDDDNVQTRAPFVFTSYTAPGADPFPPFTEYTIPCPGQIPGSFFYCPDPTPDFSNPQPLLTWNDSQTTGKIGLNWEPRDGHFIYAFVARGYKSGQSTAPTADPIRAEIVDDFEFGWKGTMAGGQLYAELGIYSMDYTDMQISSYVSDAQSAGQGTRNVGDSTIDGIEGSIRWFVGGFGLNGSFGYTESELGAITTLDQRALPFTLPFGTPAPGDISKGCVGGLPMCFDYSPYFFTLSGSENLFSPKLTYLLSVDYAFQLENGGTLTPRISVNHSDSAYESVLQQPTDRYYSTDERDVVNFSLTYEKDDWNLQLFGTNVTDELYLEGAGNSVLYGDPEVWGFRARMDF
jgi:iron complex outermembrane receptor protein